MTVNRNFCVPFTGSIYKSEKQLKAIRREQLKFKMYISFGPLAYSQQCIYRDT